MKCPFCGHPDNKVIDKRDSDTESVTRRRRECLKCSQRFTTYERLETTQIMVIKKDGARAAFDRAKIVAGIISACYKRPVTKEQIDAVVAEIEAEIRASEEAEIATKKIGNIVLKKLKKLDQIAYIRFASVYKDFKDLEEFNKELEKLIK